MVSSYTAITNCPQLTQSHTLTHCHCHTAHHVPDVISQPVDHRITAADKLQMFGLSGFLCNQENHKAGWHKGHGDNDEDGYHHICSLEPGDTEERRGDMMRREEKMRRDNEERRGETIRRAEER